MSRRKMKMVEFKVEGEVSSFLPDKKNWKLTFSDEFNCKQLDKSKWAFRRHLFHHEHGGWIEDEGIAFENGCIIFKQIEKDGKKCSCQLQTGENWYDKPFDNPNWSIAPFTQPTFEQKFGYFEARCKLQQGDDWWSAFWLQSPNIGSHRDEKKAGVEVDIMEAFVGNSVIPNFIHWGGYGLDHQFDNNLGEHRYAKLRDVMPLSDDFHTFGCLWDKDGYAFYIDGKQIGDKVRGAVSHTEQFVLLGTEIIGYRTAIPGITSELKDAVRKVKDDKFIVDYVRVFQFEE
jgi:beta-glucanase (GH16 family)